METKPQNNINDDNNNNNMKRSSSSNSDSHTHPDSPHSPLRFHSPLPSDQGDPTETPPYSSPYASPEKSQPPPPQQPQKPPPPPVNSKAIVAVAADKFTQYPPIEKLQPQPQPQPQPQAQPPEEYAEKRSPSAVVLNRFVREEMGPGMRRVGPGGSVAAAIVRRSRREETVKMGALGFRISELVLCLISFSVLAADKTQGWSGDSFDRYKEYRYCLSVNVIAFVYAGFQAYDLSYHLLTGKHVIRHHLLRHFTFFMDQILAYLLISASSSAATRVDDWQSNWGKDEFTEMASASVAMAFLAFVAFAISSLISGYSLCTFEST